MKHRDSSNVGYAIPDSLVFLNRADYERLDHEGRKFVFQRNEGDHRNPFERDRARILHSPFFRSLGGKSQIFGPNQSDFFRTRLTHSLEVAQIAKVMAVEICENYRASGCKPELSPWEQLHFCDLVEAVGLAHDLGHPPFAHTGEEALNNVLRDHGNIGFEANAQTLRILTRLDKAYPTRPGFTRGVLAGVMKYKIKKSVGLPKFIYDEDWNIVEMTCPWWRHDNRLHHAGSPEEFETQVKKWRTLACQVVDLADEVTYAGHDLEDALHTPLLPRERIEMLSTLTGHPDSDIVKKIQAEVELQSGTVLELPTLQRGWEQLRSRLLGVLRSSAPSEFRSRSHELRRQHMNSACALCRAEKDDEGNWQARISEESALRSSLIRHVIVPLVHHDSRLITLQRKGDRILRAIFEELAKDGGDELFPWDYRDKFASASESHERARICCDFIAAMTEEYALRFYQRLFESDRGVLTDFF